ncbi:uncharacterized protein V1516DRAFT_271653 [Lipomyces oligophaga]|uniref:uncharacterized protein n=1 Tax=Lipomyces oligophaga TaxID=45792 RepID=UPI0034CFCBAA
MTVFEYVIAESYLHTKCALGEGPTYISGDNSFYFLDIHAREVKWFSLADEQTVISEVNPENGNEAEPIEVFTRTSEVEVHTTKYQDPVGVLCLLPDSPKRFLVGGKRGFAIASPGKSAELEYINKIYPDNPEMEQRMRINDGNVDPIGRFLAGSMMQSWPEGTSPDLIGTMYSVDLDGSLKSLYGNQGVPNGLCWSRDGQIMFHSDSPTSTIWAYDYDLETGSASNKRAFIKITDGHPDGMTISAQGDLFIAIWEGGRIERRSSESGALKAVYKFPASKVTCPVFGGKNLDELFVTTAAVKESPTYVWSEEDYKLDKGGDLFKIRIKGQWGLPRGVYKGNL